MISLEKILSLNRAQTKFGPAPHKPVLLLSVIESFENGEIKDNWIAISDNLFQRFHDIWKLIVKTKNVPNFSLPFYHLKNEKTEFWKLITYPGKTIPTTNSNSIKSFRALRDTVMAAQLSEDVYYALTDPEHRAKLKKEILQKFFKISDINQNIRYSQTIKNEILYDPEFNYSRKVLNQISQMPKELKDEILILRSTIFRKAILEVYDNQCSVSGLKVEDASRRSLVDACHIIPFSEKYNDSIKNGIALSPTFHRAFDRGILSISDNYRILIHRGLKDFNPESGIRKFDNKQIILPDNELYWPSLSNLKEHRIKYGFNQ